MDSQKINCWNKANYFSLADTIWNLLNKRYWPLKITLFPSISFFLPCSCRKRSWRLWDPNCHCKHQVCLANHGGKYICYSPVKWTKFVVQPQKENQLSSCEDISTSEDLYVCGAHKDHPIPTRATLSVSSNKFVNQFIFCFLDFSQPGIVTWLHQFTQSPNRWLSTWNIRPSALWESPGMNFCRSLLTVESNQKPFRLTW